MKARELAEALLRYPEAEVLIEKPWGDQYGSGVDALTIKGVAFHHDGSRVYLEKGTKFKEPKVVAIGMVKSRYVKGVCNCLSGLLGTVVTAEAVGGVSRLYVIEEHKEEAERLLEAYIGGAELGLATLASPGV